MNVSLNPEAAQLIQNALTFQLSDLNKKRKELGHDYHIHRIIGFDRYERGRLKLTEKIEKLQAIISHLEPVSKGIFDEADEYAQGIFDEGYRAAEEVFGVFSEPDEDYDTISDPEEQEEGIPAQQTVHEEFELLLIVWEGEGGLCL